VDLNQHGRESTQFGEGVETMALTMTAVYNRARWLSLPRFVFNDTVADISLGETPLVMLTFFEGSVDGSAN